MTPDDDGQPSAVDPALHHPHDPAAQPHQDPPQSPPSTPVAPPGPAAPSAGPLQTGRGPLQTGPRPGFTGVGAPPPGMAPPRPAMAPPGMQVPRPGVAYPQPVPGVMSPSMVIPGRRRGERPQTQYRIGASSPVWELLAFIAMIFVTVAYISSQSVRLDVFDADTIESKIAVVLSLATMLTGCAWIRRIGVNGKQFGWPLVLIGLLPFESFFFNLGMQSTEVGIVIACTAFSMMVTLVAALVIRRTLMVGIWRAGNLPAPIFAQFGWIGSLLGTELIFTAWILALSNPVTRTYSTYGGTYTQTYYHPPNAGMTLFGLLLLIGAAIVGFVAVVGATINQHMGITADKRLLAEHDAREMARQP